MDFSDALAFMKAGSEITRQFWEDKILYRGSGIDAQRILFTSSKGSEGVWIPCGADLLAEDWQTVDEKAKGGVFSTSQATLDL